MKKKLGQHFLKDKKILEKIASVLKISPEDTIIEIGPGHGELTEYIISANPAKIIAIEKDHTFADELRGISENFPNLKIVYGDALTKLPELTKSLGSYKLVGNIPYYITGKLLRIIGELKNKPNLIVLTIQKEVAERLSAEPPKMNLLSASVKFWGEPKIIKTISRHAFHPKPKVLSAIIQITPHPVELRHGAGENQKNSDESEKYYNFIKLLFKQPRKTILNNLAKDPNYTKTEVEEFLKSQGLEPKLRPQNLDITTINNLSQSF